MLSLCSLLHVMLGFIAFLHTEQLISVMLVVNVILILFLCEHHTGNIFEA